MRGDYAFAWLYVVIWLLLASSINKMGMSKPFPIVENFVLCTSNRIEVQSMLYLFLIYDVENSRQNRYFFLSADFTAALLSGDSDFEGCLQKHMM